MPITIKKKDIAILEKGLTTTAEAEYCINITKQKKKFSLHCNAF